MRLLVRLFVKNADAVEKDEVRKDYGNLASLTDIVANMLLGLLKCAEGQIATSIYTLDDAANKH